MTIWIVYYLTNAYGNTSFWILYDTRIVMYRFLHAPSVKSPPAYALVTTTNWATYAVNDYGVVL